MVLLEDFGKEWAKIPWGHSYSTKLAQHWMLKSNINPFKKDRRMEGNEESEKGVTAWIWMQLYPP